MAYQPVYQYVPVPTGYFLPNGVFQPTPNPGNFLPPDAGVFINQQGYQEAIPMPGGFPFGMGPQFYSPPVSTAQEEVPASNLEDSIFVPNQNSAGEESTTSTNLSHHQSAASPQLSQRLDETVNCPGQGPMDSSVFVTAPTLRAEKRFSNPEPIVQSNQTSKQEMEKEAPTEAISGKICKSCTKLMSKICQPPFTSFAAMKAHAQIHAEQEGKAIDRAYSECFGTEKSKKSEKSPVHPSNQNKNVERCEPNDESQDEDFDLTSESSSSSEPEASDGPPPRLPDTVPDSNSKFEIVAEATTINVHLWTDMELGRQEDIVTTASPAVNSIHPSLQTQEKPTKKRNIREIIENQALEPTEGLRKNQISEPASLDTPKQKKSRVRPNLGKYNAIRAEVMKHYKKKKILKCHSKNCSWKSGYVCISSLEYHLFLKHLAKPRFQCNECPIRVRVQKTHTHGGKLSTFTDMLSTMEEELLQLLETCFPIQDD